MCILLCLSLLFPFCNITMTFWIQMSYGFFLLGSHDPTLILDDEVKKLSFATLMSQLINSFYEM